MMRMGILMALYFLRFSIHPETQGGPVSATCGVGLCDTLKPWPTTHRRSHSLPIFRHPDRDGVLASSGFNSVHPPRFRIVRLRELFECRSVDRFGKFASRFAPVPVRRR